MRPPRTKKITIPPEVKDEAIRNIIGQVNDFMTAVAEGLDHGLTAAENTRRQKKVLDFTTRATVADSFPMDFVCELSARPERVECGQAVAPDGGSFHATEGVTVNQWTMANGTTIRLNKITGLLPTTRYQITLFIE